MPRAYYRHIPKLWRRQRGRCWLCGRVMSTTEPSVDTYRTIDHTIPKSKGGSNHYRNLRLVCLKCNREKADAVYYVPEQRPDHVRVRIRPVLCADDLDKRS